MPEWSVQSPLALMARPVVGRATSRRHGRPSGDPPTKKPTARPSGDGQPRRTRRRVRRSPVMTTDTGLASEREESRVHGRAVSGRLLRRANVESECVGRRSGFTRRETHCRDRRSPVRGVSCAGFVAACCRTNDETPRNSAREESEVRRMNEKRRERASPEATTKEERHRARREQTSGARRRPVRRAERSGRAEGVRATAVRTSRASNRANQCGLERARSKRRKIPERLVRSASPWSTGERGALPTNRIRSEGLRRSSAESMRSKRRRTRKLSRTTRWVVCVSDERERRSEANDRSEAEHRKRRSKRERVATGATFRIRSHPFRRSSANDEAKPTTTSERSFRTTRWVVCRHPERSDGASVRWGHPANTHSRCVAVVEGGWSLRNASEGTTVVCDRMPRAERGIGRSKATSGSCGALVMREIRSATTPSRDEARSRRDLAR